MAALRRARGRRRRRRRGCPAWAPPTTGSHRPRERPRGDATVEAKEANVDRASSRDDSPRCPLRRPPRRRPHPTCPRFPRLRPQIPHPPTRSDARRTSADPRGDARSCLAARRPRTSARLTHALSRSSLTPTRRASPGRARRRCARSTPSYETKTPHPDETNFCANFDVDEIFPVMTHPPSTTRLDLPRLYLANPNAWFTSSHVFLSSPTVHHSPWNWASAPSLRTVPAASPHQYASSE